MLALQRENAGTVDFIVVDVETAEGSAMAREYGVTGIPAFYLFDREGRLVQTSMGFAGKDALQAEIKHLNP